MTKRVVILILAGIVSFALIVVGLLLVLRGAAPTEEAVKPREFTVFPRPEAAQEGKELPLTEKEVTGILPIAPSAPKAPPKLEKISDLAVAGAAILTKERPLNPEESALETFDFSKYPNLKLGLTGGEVRNLQIVLNRFIEKQNKTKPAEKQLTALAEDGNFNESTKNLLIVFQKENNLSADGVLGKKTKTILNEFQEPRTETAFLLRYAAKESGHIYETYLDDIELRKISNTTIPRLAQAFFTADDKAVFRYAKDGVIETFLGALDEENENGFRDFSGSFLSSNIIDLSFSPDYKNLFYLAETKLENLTGSAGIITNGSGKETRVFESPFTEWLVQWTDKIYLQTKPSVFFGGYLYSLDPKTRLSSKILGNIAGLTSLASPDGKTILISSSENQSLRTQIFNVGQKTAADLGIKTLPEKCVFNSGGDKVYCAVPKSLPAGNYPDEWYQGLISFNDDIWQINLETLSDTVIAEPAKETGGEVDAISLIIDPAEKNLVFINKKDNRLWRVRL